MAARPRPSSDEAREALRDAMARLAAGDQAALEEIYRATRVKLFGITLRILGDPKEAEDALKADAYTMDMSAAFHTRLASCTHNPAIEMLVRSFHGPLLMSLNEARVNAPLMGRKGTAEHAQLVKETRDASFQETDEDGVPVMRTHAIGHFGGATLDNEENYLIKKLLAGGLGIIGVENQARI